MFVAERLNTIIKLINEKGKINVNELSKMFNVSKDLIRKDLAKLENQNVLERTYGGAIKKRYNAEITTITSRISKNIKQKNIISNKALKQIKRNDIVFLDISSTNYVLAQEIIKNNMEITIITNMIDIIQLFSSNPKVKTKLIAIGGKFHPIIDGFVGSFSIEQIKNFYIDKCFIGAIGVNSYNGNISTFDEEDGLTKKTILKMSKYRYLVMEKNKFEQDGKFIFANLIDFNALVLDQEISCEEKKQFNKFDIKLY